MNCEEDGCDSPATYTVTVYGYDGMGAEAMCDEHFLARWKTADEGAPYGAVRIPVS